MDVAKTDSIKASEKVKRIFEEKGFCPNRVKKVEKEWKICPYCATPLKIGGRENQAIKKGIANNESGN